ncbi:MAG: NAD-dependent succinate-semialdehyde dehydrogenase, partial [Rickettsiales bacterium]|nr:NAD-dependent succinate-semialdehyde dehydrogenase [Rickettsiales bacterium]
IQQYEEHTPAQTQAIIDDTYACFLQWRKTSFAERKTLILKAVDVILKRKEEFGRVISLEMGKPLKEAVTEVEKCASAGKYFAENSEAFLADQPIKTEYSKSYVTFQPLGVIFGVMPWNFPFWQVLRYAFPALMAGNTCLLKHASNTPGCALALESIFKEAGLPAHAFRSLLIPGKRVEEAISNPKVAAVTLTGSTPAGSAVASLAGKYLKKTVLELGGSDAYLVLHDADIEHAINTIAPGRLLNCGQSCVSPKRLVVHESLKEKFEQGFVKFFESQKLGDQLDPSTTMGPMSRADLRDELHEQVQKSIRQGARLLTGGTPGKGAFYAPTVLTDVKKGMTAYEEEMFGPVAVIIGAKDDEEAIAIAADTVFGLGGSVFTRDKERGERIARDRIESGACFVNMMLRSDPRLPFGGIKQSGYGRELSFLGQMEFVNIKTVVVA